MPVCSLVHLYNSLEDSSFSLRAQKLSLIATVISYASNTKQLDQLAPYLASAASWQKEWQLSNAEARGLFLLLSRAYGKAGDGSSAQAFLIRYLQTFEPSVAADGSSAAASPASLEEAKEHAKEAAIGYIRAPALSQRSALAHLAAVSHKKPPFFPCLFFFFLSFLTAFPTRGMINNSGFI